MKKLLSKTTVWKYEDKTIVHCKTEPTYEPILFSSGKPFDWEDKGGYVEWGDGRDGKGYIGTPLWVLWMKLKDWFSSLVLHQ